VSLAQAKDMAGAMAALSKAVSLEPREDRYKVALVSVTYDVQGPDAALTTAKSFAKDGPIGDLLAADVLARNGKAGDAIALLGKAQAANPSKPVAFKLAELNERNKDVKRAVAVMEEWAKAHPDDGETRLALAQLYSRARNYGLAQAQFEKLAVERPNDIIVLNNLAWIYGRANDPRARKMAEKAYQLAPKAPAIADTLGWIMTAQGDAPNAMKYLQVALGGLPNNPDVQYHYALALSKTNKIGDARAMLQKALAAKDDFESKADAKQLLDRLAAAGVASGGTK
jgi:Flp pilus assembly protein TadD